MSDKKGSVNVEFEDFKLDVRDWVAYDDKVAKAKLVIEKVKVKQTDISKDIVHFMKRNKLQKKEIKIRDSRLRCGKTTKTTPLTKKFILGCLTEFLRDQDQAKEAVDMMYKPPEKIKACLSIFFDDEIKAEEATNYIFSRRTKTVTTILKRKKQRAPVEVESGPASQAAQNAMRTPHDTEAESDSESDYDD
jgi:hypothetical protein